MPRAWLAQGKADAVATHAPRIGFNARPRDERPAFSLDSRTRRVLAIAGLVAFGAAWGAAIAFAGVAAAIVCVTLIACAFCVRDFRIGVMLLVVIMPISQSYVFPHEMFGITGLNPLNLVMVATFTMMVMRTAGEGTLARLVPRPLAWLYLLPLAFGALIGAPHSGEIPAIFRDLELIFFDNAFGYVRDMALKPATFVVYALMISVAVARSEKPEALLVPMLASVAAMAAVVLVFIALAGISISQLSGMYARQFLSSLGMHANDLGRLYAVAYALLLFMWDRTDRIGMKTVTLFAMGAVVLALLLTFSRGAFFGFILVNVIYLLSRRQGKTLGLAVVLIPIGLYFTPGAVWDRVTMGWGQGADTISAGRVDSIWLPLLPDLWQSPIWGNGLGAILWSKAMLTGQIFQVSHPHNAYLEVLLDLGVVGLAMVLAFWIITWKDFRRLSRDPRLAPELQGFFEGAAAGLLSFLVAGMAGSSLLPAPEQAFLWLAVGMMYGVRKKLAPRVPAHK